MIVRAKAALSKVIMRPLQQRKAPIKAAGMGVLIGRKAKVPFPRHHRVIPCRAHPFRQGSYPWGKMALIAPVSTIASSLGHGPYPGRMVVRARQKHGSRGGTGRRSVKVSQPQPCIGERIQIRSEEHTSELQSLMRI